MPRLWPVLLVVASLAGCREAPPIPPPTLPAATLPELPHPPGEAHAPPVPPPTTTTTDPGGTGR